METNQALLQDIIVTGVITAPLMNDKISEILEHSAIAEKSIANDVKTGQKAIKAALKKKMPHIIILHGVKKPEREQIEQLCAKEEHSAIYQIIIEDKSENEDFTPSEMSAALPVPFRPGALIDMLIYFAKRAKTRHTKKTYKIGPYSFHPVWLTLSPTKGEDIKLTEKERDVLLLLLNSEDHTISREDLLEVVWGYRADTETHTTETHIYRLRQKIEQDPSAPEIVITIPEGYKIQP